MPKEKKVCFELVQRLDNGKLAEPYRILEGFVARHRPDLGEAVFGIAWHTGWKRGKDGFRKLGLCRLASDLDRELNIYDFIVILNRQAYDELNDHQRQALIFHELCHADVAKDKHGEPRRDDRGRLVYRLRKHDLEEFAEVVEKFGLYLADVERFAESVLKAKRNGPSLFRSSQPEEEAVEEGRAAV